MEEQNRSENSVLSHYFYYYPMTKPEDSYTKIACEVSVNLRHSFKHASYTVRSLP